MGPNIFPWEINDNYKLFVSTWLLVSVLREPFPACEFQHEMIGVRQGF